MYTGNWHTRIVASILLFCFVVPQLAEAATETRTFATGGAGTWVAPAGVTSVKAETWAGGGGGGGTAAAGNGGGGGAGGGYARVNAFVTTPGNTYNFYIGRGGAGGNGTNNGSNGEDSAFNASSTVLSVGGQGGRSLANGGTGGATTTGSTAVGDVIFHGGNGGTGSGTSGGGGGGAGDAGNAGAANGSIGGFGGSTGGGNGADGVSGNSVGAAGNSAGGGASGADSNNATARTGGQGAAGMLKVTYTIYTILANSTDPGNTTLTGGDPATLAGAFTFQTSTTTDTVTAAVVDLGSGASGGISLVEITNAAGTTVYGSTANPSSDTPSITLNTNTLTATTTATIYKIRITPNTTVTGGPYTVTAKISSWTSTNTQQGSDTAGTTITINNGGAATAPTVTTQAASSVGATSATLNGNITDTGGATVTDRGFAVGLFSNLSSGVSTTTESGTFSTGAFTGSASALTGNTTYYFRPFATNSAGTGYGSSILNFLTLPDTQGTPTFNTTAATSTGITWTVINGGAATYKLEQCQGATCSLFTNISSNSTTTYSLIGNTTYDYAVRGNNATGDGAFSATSSILTLPDIPGTPSFSNVTESTLTATWSAPSGGASTYKLERCAGAGCTNFTEIYNNTTNSFADSSLLSSTLYRYRVHGANATGDGLYSAIAEVTTSAAQSSTVVRILRLMGGIRLMGGVKIK